MLGIITVIFLTLWLFGMVSAHTGGGWVHGLIVSAVVVVVVRYLQRRRLKVSEQSGL
jgi:multisubunit Na+/H+ antiporter MnhE subunit